MTTTSPGYARGLGLLRQAALPHLGITAPFWFAFAGSAIILALIWGALEQIAHAGD